MGACFAMANADDVVFSFIGGLLAALLRTAGTASRGAKGGRVPFQLLPSLRDVPKQVLYALLAIVPLVISFKGATTYLSAYLIEAKGLHPVTVGAFLSLLTISLTIVNPVKGRLVDMLARRRGRALLMALLATSASRSLYLLSLTFVPSAPALFAVILLNLPYLNPLFVGKVLYEEVPPRVRGKVFGASNSIKALSGSAALLLYGYLWGLSPTYVFATASSLALLPIPFILKALRGDKV